jgi:hypothetical protein
MFGVWSMIAPRFARGLFEGHPGAFAQHDLRAVIEVAEPSGNS